jgi:ACS family glucarate transporter-like MFS transporter
MLRFGWRASFYVTALAAFAISLIWTSFTKTPPPSGRTEVVDAAEQVGKSDQVAEAEHDERPWFNTNVALLSISYASEGYLLFTFVSWLYIYLVEVRGFSLASGGLVTSLPWITAIAATPFGGFMSDKLTMRYGRVSSAQILITTGYTLSGLLLLVAAEVHGRLWAVLALCISLGSMYLAESSFWTTATSIAGRHASVVAGFMNTIGILGGIASNTLVPLLVRHYGRTGWILAFSSGTAMGLMTATVWWILARRIKRFATPRLLSATQKP